MTTSEKMKTLAAIMTVVDRRIALLEDAVEQEKWDIATLHCQALQTLMVCLKKETADEIKKTEKIIKKVLAK